jgi:hypothetical protein
LDLGKLTKQVELPAEESGTSDTQLDVPQPYRYVSFRLKHSLCGQISVGTQQQAITLFYYTKPDHCVATSVDPSHSYEGLLNNDQVFIRSTRLLERRSKKRNAHRALSNDVPCSGVSSKRKEKSKKFGRVLDPDEPFRLFLRDRETTEFLTAKEEKQMFSQIQAQLLRFNIAVLP